MGIGAVALFVLLTFGLTWTVWIAPALIAPGRALLGLGGPVFLLGVFAPAIVGIALTAYADGRAGVARLLARIGKWRVAGRYYLFAAGYIVAVKLLAALIQRIVTGAWPGFGDGSVVLMLGALFFSTWMQAGEEIGWRGYALPRLAARFGLGAAGVLLGVVWALWHLPLFFIPGGESQSFPLYVLFVTTVSVAMSWLYWRTEGSLLLAMLMHASVNNTTIVPLAAPGPVDPMSFEGSWVAWATVGVSWVIAAVLLRSMRGARIGAISRA